MQQAFHADCMRYFLGDVRDEPRLKRAMEGVHYAVHAAALKQVPAAEYNPMECIKTNVQGAQNVIDAAISCGAEKVIALSTDKAANPINLYGATKLCSDKLKIKITDKKLSIRPSFFIIINNGIIAAFNGSIMPLKKIMYKKVFPLNE